MGAIHSNTAGPYNNSKKKKSSNIHHQNPNHNPNCRFYQVESDSVKVTPDDNMCHKLE